MQKATSDFAFSTSVSVVRLEAWVMYLNVLHVGAGLEKMCVFNCAHSSLSRPIPIRSH